MIVYTIATKMQVYRICVEDEYTGQGDYPPVFYSYDQAKQYLADLDDENKTVVSMSLI